MLYGADEIRERILLGEDSGCEFKRIEFAGDVPRRPRRDDLADEIAALANAGGGLLLCGVADDGRVPGMTRAQLAALDSRIVEISTDAIKPPVPVRTYHRLIDGKPLLLVEIPEGEALHDSPGGSFLRIGSSKKRMSSEERLRLAQRRGQARFRSFDEQTLPNTGFRTLDEALWKPLLSAEGAIDPAGALEKLALLARDPAGTVRATVAGVLLCTPDPAQWLPAARIAATFYRGRDRASGQLDAQEILGPLDRQIAAAVAFAARNMRVGARKEPWRVDLPQYSMAAVFEAIVNAVVHRDYSIRASAIRLSLFADRLEIQSPGALPNNLTIDSMAKRQATRNEVLASLLGRMSVGAIPGSEERRYFMERRGDGVPIIVRETQSLSGRPPEYELIDDSEIRLAIPAAEQQSSPATVVIAVRANEAPLADADILTLFPNGSWERSRSDAEGNASAHLHTSHLPLTVFAAAPGYAACVESGWIPGERPLALQLAPLPGGGAVILPEGSGRIPGLAGTIEPKRDALDRICIHAAHIAINDGAPQPVHCLPGEPLQLTDATGATRTVRIAGMVGGAAIVEYEGKHEETPP